MADGFRTRSLHGSGRPDPATGARATPIYQTTSYAFEDADAVAEQYALRRGGHVYSRISNPTVETLENRLAALAGGIEAIATGAGMAALDSLTTVLASAGDSIVASSDCYGGTGTYFSTLAPRRGIEVRTVDTLAYDAYEAAIDETTAYVHVETLSNPSLLTPDFERLAAIAHDHAVPLVVDNTFATPYLCRPIEHGADLVWESTTKWIHGSGTTIGGVLVDGGTFPWDHPDADYPELSGDNPAFGFDFTDRFGDRAFAVAARHRALRLLGNGQSPFDAWVTMQGLETLPLRMERHGENARTVAEFLREDDRIAWVRYPGFEAHPTHENAARYLDGFGGMIAFGLEGGYGAAKAVCEGVELVSFLANIGDAKSLIIHPASTTHAQLSREAQRAAGVEPEMLRLSVGIEDADDVIADLDRAISLAHTDHDNTSEPGSETTE